DLHDLLRPDASRHGALRMTEAARPILRGEASIDLRRDTITANISQRPEVKSLVAEEDEPLLAALKSKRRELAEALKAPAYVVFPDRTLIEMTTQRPATLDDFSRLAGVGATKLEKYGRVFLDVINGGPVAQMHPARRKLAGRDGGEVFDRLLAAQLDLARGEDGAGKPLSCSASSLAKLAAARPRDMPALNRMLGEAKAERFGARFLDILHDS
ncbi:MAG TPA: ATP-dependent DNA helicase RecQ, partial [Rhodobacteraceae bacterium]|nr:ATP-dependent DNA helicase RecQ [Paracoccaceae bacterium]